MKFILLRVMVRRDAYTLLYSLTIFIVWIYARGLWLLGETSQLALSILFGLAIWELSCRRETAVHPRIKFPCSVMGGMGVTAVVYLTIVSLNGYSIRVLPFAAGLSIILLFFNLDGLRVFGRELTILFFLGIPSAVSWAIINPSRLTAWFTTKILHFLGFDSVSQGTIIRLFDKEVGVVQGCSGLNAMNYLLGISVVFLILFPMHGKKRYGMPLLAIVLGFIGNACRAALLTYFNAVDMTESFHYWHGGKGAVLFGCMSTIIFSLVYLNLIKWDKRNSLALRRFHN